MWALNSAFGVEAPAAAVANSAQRAALEHIFASVASGRPGSVLPPRAAARELLGNRMDYLGSGSRVQAFGTAPVSLPSGLRESVDMSSALGPSLARVVEAETLLADAPSSPPGVLSR